MKKLTKQFVEKLLKEHGLELKSEYRNTKTKIVFSDNLGYSYEMMFDSFLRYGCPAPFKKSNSYTIANIRTFLKNNNIKIELLSESYDYANSELKCKCLECGSIFYKSFNEIRRKQTCSSCAIKKRSGILSKSHYNFIYELKDRQLELYNSIAILNEYKNMHTKILIEDKYGRCLVSPNALLNGFKPSIFTSIDKSEYFKNKAIEVHGSEYDYSKVEYINNKIEVCIICPVHGEFWQTPNIHLGGSKCQICANEAKGGRGCGGYNLTVASRNKQEWLNKDCKLYLIKMENKKCSESFYKIGISRKLKNRILQLSKFYNCTLIASINSNLYDCINLEDKILRSNKLNSYSPINDFGGKTECFEFVDLSDFYEEDWVIS